MISGSSTGVEGHYKIAIKKPDGTIDKPFGDRWHKNVITDQALQGFMNTLDFGQGISSCVVGTGNTTPTVADTSLVAQAMSAGFGSGSSSIDPAPPYAYTGTCYFTFAARTGTNITLSEIGIKSSNGIMFSRALIVDVGGNPTTLTLLVGEILIVTYQFTMTPNIEDQTGTFVLNGTTHTWVLRPQNVNNSYYSGSWPTAPDLQQYSSQTYMCTDFVLGPITSSPSHSALQGLTQNRTDGPPGSYYREFYVSATITQCNFTNGISGWKSRSLGCHVDGSGSATGWSYQCSIDPPIMKTADDLFTMRYRTTITRT